MSPIHPAELSSIEVGYPDVFAELTRLRNENARLVDAINEYFASGANAYTSGGHHFYCSETRRIGPCDCAYGRLMDAKAKVSS